MKEAKPNAALDRGAGIFPREALALGVVVAFPERAIEQGVEIYFLVDQLSGRRRLSLAHKISPPKFVRRQVHGACYLIEVAFHRENTLRRAETAKRAVRRSVGRHGLRMDAHVGTDVGPRRVNRAAREHHGRKRRVSAAINHEIDVHRHQLAVARDAGAVPRARWMALGGRHHVFRAVVNNFHGLPDFHARSAACPAIMEGYSSLPPKPPPVSA